MRKNKKGVLFYIFIIISISSSIMSGLKKHFYSQAP